MHDLWKFWQSAGLMFSEILKSSPFNASKRGKRYYSLKSHDADDFKGKFEGITFVDRK